MVDAEEMMIDFCEHMHTFNEISFEENLERAKHLVSKPVFNEIYEAYYVLPQENSKTAYVNWVSNNLKITLKIDSVNSYYKDTKIVVDLYGSQVYQKTYNSAMKEGVDIFY